tara:strand:- start:14668 stop:15261 length:594 start_codon:yes stop_codon:yes gene_type:complete
MKKMSTKTTRDRIRLGELTQVSKEAAILLTNEDLIAELEQESEIGSAVIAVKMKSWMTHEVRDQLLRTRQILKENPIIQEDEIPVTYETSFSTTRGKVLAVLGGGPSAVQALREEADKRTLAAIKKDLEGSDLAEAKLIMDIFHGDPGDMDPKELRLIELERVRRQTIDKAEAALITARQVMKLMADIIEISQTSRP